MLVLSSSRGEVVDMGRLKADCKTCGKTDIYFAVRLCIEECERYSAPSSSKRRFVKLVCQGCTAEQRAVRDIEKWAIARYDSAAGELERARISA